MMSLNTFHGWFTALSSSFLRNESFCLAVRFLSTAEEKEIFSPLIEPYNSSILI